MDDRLFVGIPPRYVTSHPSQFSLLPLSEREMSTGQSAAMLWLVPFVNKRVSDR